MDEETIKAKIAEIEQERQEFLNDANQTIAYYNGKIAALKEILPGQEEENGTSEPAEEPEKKEKSHD